MEIVCLLGSPRLNGNSCTLAKEFCDTAQSLGADVRTFALNKLQYQGCQACMACKTKLDHCIINDDLTEVLQSVAEADILVMATPTYYGEVSSQLKAFIDRTYSYLVPDFIDSPNPSRLLPGKQMVFIQAQGYPDENYYSDVFPKYAKFFRWYGFEDCHCIRVCGVNKPNDVAIREDVLSQARQTAQKIVKR
ncbi:MAG TPA: flavodoxin family protein [Thermodesulfovibrionia bacterium]|nr:flavodoxin family protein [Thermodesulfovibrionia bacterium]